MPKATKKKAAKKTSKRKTGLPNLDNATPPILTDWLGSVREQMKELKQLEGYYKEALMARADGEEIVGEQFTATIEDVEQMRIDTTAVKDEMGDEWWGDHCKLIEYKMIKTKRNTS